MSMGNLLEVEMQSLELKSASSDVVSRIQILSVKRNAACRNLLCKFSATFSLIGLDGHGWMTMGL